MKETAAHSGDLTAGIAAAVSWLASHVPVLSLNLIVVTPTDMWVLRYPLTNELYLLDRDFGGHRGDQHLHGVGQHGGIRIRSSDLRERRAIVAASEPIDENPAWQILASGELAVMPSQVVDSTDGGLPPESGVAAVMIVEMQE